MNYVIFLARLCFFIYSLCVLVFSLHIIIYHSNMPLSLSPEAFSAYTQIYHKRIHWRSEAIAMLRRATRIWKMNNTNKN